MNNTVPRAALIAALVALAPAHATTLGLHLASVHSTPGWCDFNPGLYLRTDAGLTLGAYRNSECRASVYAGWTWEARRGRWAAAVTAGAVTGYTSRPVLPLLVPSLAVDVADKTALRLTYIPKTEKAGAHALHLSVERRF